MIPINDVLTFAQHTVVHLVHNQILWLLVSLRQDPRGAIKRYRNSAAAMAFIRSLFIATERLRGGDEASAML